MRNIRMDGLVIADSYTQTLIKATANCKDMRSGEVVPLTFYFDRSIPEYCRNKETASRLISNTVRNYGFEYIRLKDFEIIEYLVDGEADWTQYAEAAA